MHPGPRRRTAKGAAAPAPAAEAAPARKGWGDESDDDESPVSSPQLTKDRRVADHDPNPFLSDVTDSVDWLQRQFDSNEANEAELPSLGLAVHSDPY